MLLFWMHICSPECWIHTSSLHRATTLQHSIFKNNKVLSEGVREGQHLYHIQCNMPYFKQATITHAFPNLETRHQKLGHVNYASIVKMANKGTATGMPTDLSTL